jgi:hypothetical protein
MLACVVVAIGLAFCLETREWAAAWSEAWCAGAKIDREFRSAAARRRAGRAVRGGAATTCCLSWCRFSVEAPAGGSTLVRPIGTPPRTCRPPLAAWQRAAALMGLCVAASALGQSPPCDPSLSAPAGDPLGYRLRGDRCEGRYAKDVGNTTLTLGSLVASFAAIEPASKQPLRVTWLPPPRSATVWLRAQGLKRRLYYRMDTRVPAGAAVYAWPSDVLAGMAPASGDIGVLAWVRQRVGDGGGERDVYLPARVGYGDATPVRATRYELVVVPGVQLAELLVAVNALDDDGRTLRSVRAAEPLQYGYYPAERGISISLPEAWFGAPGQYQVQLTARLDGGGAASTELWLYHARRP